MTKRSLTSWLGVISLGVSLHLTALPRIAAAMPPQVQSSQSHSDGSEQTDSDAAKPQSLDLTEEVVRDVLSSLQHAIEGRNLNQMLAIFDPQKPNYAELRDQFMAFFQRYDVIQFRYQVLQVTSEKDHAFVICDIDLDATPSDNSQVALRRSVQMRFQMKLSPRGWRVTGFKPDDFFAQ